MFIHKFIHKCPADESGSRISVCKLMHFPHQQWPGAFTVESLQLELKPGCLFTASRLVWTPLWLTVRVRAPASSSSGQKTVTPVCMRSFPCHEPSEEKQPLRASVFIPKTRNPHQRATYSMSAAHIHTCTRTHRGLGKLRAVKRLSGNVRHG